MESLLYHLIKSQLETHCQKKKHKDKFLLRLLLLTYYLYNLLIIKRNKTEMEEWPVKYMSYILSMLNCRLCGLVSSRAGCMSTMYWSSCTPCAKLTRWKISRVPNMFSQKMIYCNLYDTFQIMQLSMFAGYLECSGNSQYRSSPLVN